MAKKKKKLALTPLQVLGLGLSLIDSSTDRATRGKLGTFRLGDLTATQEAMIARTRYQWEIVKRLCEQYGEATLIAEAKLTKAELLEVTQAALDVSAFGRAFEQF